MTRDRSDARPQQPAYREMLRIRRFEERCVELYSAAQIRGFLHLYIGEEAVAVGVMGALQPEDNVVATYREHGHALVRGVSARAIMAEMFGRVEGCSRGRGGSMHLFDIGKRFYGGNAIVGGGLPIAVGLALADRLQQRAAATAVFFGEGAVAEGEFHECMNLAALWELPVLFVCENNLYAMGTALGRSQVETDLALRAAELRDARMVGRRDGRPRDEHKPLDMRPRPYGKVAGRTSSSAAPTASVPTRCTTRTSIETRPRSSTGRSGIRSSLLGGRLRDERRARRRCPRRDRGRGRRRGRRRGGIAEAGAQRADRATSLGSSRLGGRAMTVATAHLTYREAMREALREAMHSDDRVFLMGEDVGRYGGSFGVSRGLLDEFGPTASATRRSRSPRSSVPASAPPSVACARSSRS